jgi:hypothetical protein
MTIERDHHGFAAPAPLGQPGRAGLPDGHPTGPDVGERLSSLLDAALARHPDRAVEIAPDSEVRRGLEALGYVE